MFRALGVWFVFLSSLAWGGQLSAAKPGDVKSESAKAETSKEDHSQEAFVIEQFSEKATFENDGTSLREETARVRIQSDAGVQQYSLLSFSYASGTGTFDIGYVRVRKPDGSVIDTPPDNVQDMAADITRAAPFYSDLHEKHVAIKGLGVGDVLEYKIEEHTTKPLAPGQFWTGYNFTKDQIILDEQLEIRVPRDRAVKVKSSTIQPTITDTGGYRTYTWHNANLKHKDESNDKRETIEKIWQAARGRLPQLDVLLSSFANWEEVGRWYGGLQAERVKPTPEITAKAAELTKNAASDEAKMRSIYNYVSTQFHYIGVAFGIGRYQPHPAAEVLANQYGDCKDKHTLLASLLTAAGFQAYPALISVSHEVDDEVPSPGQFDHVITAVQMGGGLIWLDSTTEVGPYQYLVSPLRDKRALVIWHDKAASLVSTPADVPGGASQTFNMDAKLSEEGTLEGRAEMTSRGDSEVIFRSAFRTLPFLRWKDLAQRISQASGFGGEVSEVTAGSPEKTEEPFHFAYKYTRKEFGDWGNRRILAPEPFISLPSPGDEESLPLGPTWLGSLVEIHFRSTVELPSGYRPQLPEAIHVKKDFAEFDATYEFKDGKMISERHFKTLMHEVPPSEREDYKSLVKTVQDDYGVFIPLTSGLAAAGAANRNAASMNPLRNLPDSSNAEALRLEGDARAAFLGNDLQGAVSSLYRAVAADPKFSRAWVLLGTALFAQKQNEAGLDAFHKAMAIDPAQSSIPKALGFGLMSDSQFESAVGVWQDYIKTFPDDPDGPANLGACLRRLKRYPEATAAYEMALKKDATNLALQVSLASTYLEAGEREKAGTAYAKVAELDPEGLSFNDVAYEMANSDLQLPLALDYAQKAVHRSEEQSQKIKLADLKSEDLNKTIQLGAFWDTLGWVQERMSNMDAAESYLRAAWMLSQDGVIAGHLCHLYRREHKTQLAIQNCRLAIYRIPMSQSASLENYKKELEAARENLDYLTGGAKTKSDPSGDIVVRERTFKLPRFLPGTESAEFFVLLASDGKSKAFKVEDVKFISGSDKMKLQGKQLKTIDFNVPAPSDVPARFVRRGILGCYQYSGCSFVLLDPASVHSIN